MFSRLIMFGLVLMLTSGMVLADTLDKPNTCAPGFVQADCNAEETRFNKICTGTALDENDEPEPISKRCDSMKQDLDACNEQCVPRVTNGGILPGPKNGATAKNYLLNKFLPGITNSFLVFNMVVGVIIMIISGFMWIFASGSEEMKNKARDTMIWSIIGLTVGVLAYVLVKIVININFFA